MESDRYHSTYRGHDIYRKNGTGYYVTFISGVGQLVADTIEGIRASIRDHVNTSDR